MKQLHVTTRMMLAVLLAVSGFSACFAEPSLRRAPQASGGAAGSEGGAGPTTPGGMAGEIAAPVCVAREAVKGAECRPVTSSEPLRQRVIENVPQDTLYFTETLFGEFNSLCGSCHVASNLGGFGVNRSNFATVIDDKVLSAIRSNTAHCELGSDGLKKDKSCFSFMPPDGSPNGKPWSAREDKPSDPVTRLAGLLELWIEAERPADAFTIPAALGGTTPYAIDADFAETFTNIGTCVPDAGMVATELDQSCALDAKFAELKKDPDSSLGEEQLGLPTTLDQTDLNTLDSAELARHGVVAYAPTYPLWSDDAGKLRHVRVPQGQSIKFNKRTKEFEIPKNTRFYKTFMKKILDRDGTERFRKIETRIIVSRPGEDSLFGTYLWNEEETQATLLTEPLNNGRPFKDKLLTLVTDVPMADDIKAQWEAGKIRNYSKELDYAGAVRRYAVPSSERCIQCHMGGPGRSFVLGFMPLDIHARPCDRATLDAQGHCDGGVIEPASGDQLTQLERLISYGVITDYDIATELVTLEDPQGPSGAPRKHRTPEELTAQGYVLGNCAHCHTPEGYPSVLNPELAPLLDFRPGEAGGIFGFPLDRFSPRITRQLGAVQMPYITPSLRDLVSTPDNWKEKRYKAQGTAGDVRFIDAPWRSLIYRNVDTPFTYGDDLAIFPHMPLNTPGFDCRAPRILGEWMVSIPAVRKHPELVEDVVAATDAQIDNDPQPYVEVQEGHPQFFNAVIKAQTRLETFRNGLRGNNYCPENKDIVDVFGIVYGTNQVPADGAVKGMPPEGVPDRTHWVVTDVTDPPGEWNPRRTDWKTVLVDQNFTDSEAALKDLTGVLLQLEQARIESEKVTVAMLQDLKPSAAFATFARKKLPFGAWLKKETCDFSGVPKVAEYGGAERPRARWMDLGAVPAETPVYETVPGAAVYNMICVNCHGPEADSQGRQAITLQELTGGTGRVANFRDGLFGPFGDGGANRLRVFASDDVAMRYLPWMALGGTRTKIPSIILNLVSATPVLGLPRPDAPPVVNANMLETARALCRSVVKRGNGKGFNPQGLNSSQGSLALHKGSGLISANGDAELWGALCSFDNPAPIHAITVTSTGDPPAPALFLYSDYFDATAYPAGTAVGNVRGGVDSVLLPGNDFPWCIQQPTDPAQLAFVEAARSSDGKKLPICPPALLTDEYRWLSNETSTPKLEAYATRGAINAGWAVFYYLDEIISQGRSRTPSFNECERLTETAKP
jgi:mono/diheme cytochrome c family protein